MRFLTLDMVNIGPFDEARLDFRVTPGDEMAEAAHVTFVTGVNGTGKSIVIDAIRSVFGEQYTGRMRPIIRESNHNGNAFEVTATIHDGEARRTFPFDKSVAGFRLVGRSVDFYELNQLPVKIKNKTAPAPGWVVDYWQSSLDTAPFDIKSLTAPDHTSFLYHSLSGIHTNPETTSFVCHIDYLRDSQDPTEQRQGKLLYDAFQKIAALSVPDGHFAHVARARLEPMFMQRGRLIGISKLAAGSQYWIARLLGLLNRMHSCQLMSGGEVENVLETPGLLLIDEAENHLHPQWQKRFIPMIRDIFPNLQLIVATHSPFILASVHGARVYVCQSDGDHCTVADVTDEYADRPVDEILMSPAFAETRPFSQEISDLLERRAKAIADDDREERARIERELLDRNREYFEYFNVSKLLCEVVGSAE